MIRIPSDKTSSDTSSDRTTFEQVSADSRESFVVDSLVLRDFRNVVRREFSFTEGPNILLGPNGVGKTNVLEALCLLSSQRSFRLASPEDFVRFGCESASIGLAAHEGERLLELDAAFSAGSKTYRLNGKKAQPKRLKGLLPCVAFTPDDLDIVKASDSRRRDDLDSFASGLSSAYATLKKDYEKMVRQKTELLKSSADPLLLATYNDLIAPYAARLHQKRHSLAERIAGRIGTSYHEVSGDGSILEYRYAFHTFHHAQPDESMDVEQLTECYRTELEARMQDEIVRRRCLVGPHRDELSFELSGHPARLFASQGQQRSIVLAYKMAHFSVMEELLERKPFLILDDVMSELDDARRASLMDFISRDVQSFISSAHVDYFSPEFLASASLMRM